MKHFENFLNILILSILFSCNSSTKLIEQKGWINIKENQYFDEYTRKNNNIYCGETGCRAKPMEGIDISTFKVLPGSGYAKDKNNVYYPISITCDDYTDCGVCFCDKYVINNVNTESFRYLKKDYATDGERVFFRGQEIDDCDGENVRVIDGPEYFYFISDNHHVYIHGQLFENADPLTFQFDSVKQNSSDVGWTIYIMKDKNYIWEYSPPDSILSIRQNKTKIIK